MIISYISYISEKGNKNIMGLIERSNGGAEHFVKLKEKQILRRGSD